MPSLMALLVNNIIRLLIPFGLVVVVTSMIKKPYHGP